MSVVRAHRLRLPSDLALLLKTVMMCEGVAAQLDPTFELIPTLLPYAARLASDDTT
jgi:ubiquinone biosynthesis protein